MRKGDGDRRHAPGARGTAQTQAGGSSHLIISVLLVKKEGAASKETADV